MLQKKYVKALSEAPDRPESLANFKEADTVMDMRKRLVARQEVRWIVCVLETSTANTLVQVLRLSSDGGTSDIYHRYVMNQIAAIKFDIDWELTGTGDGGTRRKTRFYEAASYEKGAGNQMMRDSRTRQEWLARSRRSTTNGGGSWDIR